ncbi:MAG: hypothetical protein ABJB86_16630 [Bacteroidota bacterium]
MKLVKTCCRNLTFLLFFSLLILNADAQVFSNDAGAREKKFLYEVKQIDEFFERFNNDTSSFIRQAYKTHHVQYKLDRSALIKSLFNYDSQTWNQAMINDFVNDAVLTTNPQKIDFRAAGWFAQANCKFQYNGTPISIAVILRIITDGKRRSRWMIASVKSPVLKPVTNTVPIKKNGDVSKFINPASHASNFIELDRIFDDKENLADYFEPVFFKTKNAYSFYEGVSTNHIKFLYVHDITYHFLQVDKWLFTVVYFHRKSLNAGWLINSLKKVSGEEKKDYLKNLLEEQ